LGRGHRGERGKGVGNGRKRKMLKGEALFSINTPPGKELTAVSLDNEATWKVKN